MTNSSLKNNTELLDAYSLGYVSIEWFIVLIKQISNEVKSIKNDLANKGFNDINFFDLEKLISITGFIADEQFEHFAEFIEQYTVATLDKKLDQIELKFNKKVVSQ